MEPKRASVAKTTILPRAFRAVNSIPQLALLLLLGSVLPSFPQALLQQNFNQSTSLGDYFNLTAPTTAQFNSISGTAGAGATVMDIASQVGLGTSLVLSRPGAGLVSVVHTTDLAASVGAVVDQMRSTTGRIKPVADSVLFSQLGTNLSAAFVLALTVFLLCFTTQAANWSSWAGFSDFRGIKYRPKVDFKANGKTIWHVEVGNHYAQPAHLSCVLTPAGGTEAGTTDRISIRPEASTSAFFVLPDQAGGRVQFKIGKVRLGKDEGAYYRGE